MDGGIDEILKWAVGSLGMGGALAWYCYYLTTTAIPRLVAEFREENRLVREEARAEREHADARAERMAAAVERMVGECSVARGGA